MCMKTREKALNLPYYVCLVRLREQKSKKSAITHQWGVKLAGSRTTSIGFYAGYNLVAYNL
jgi:hypothetical protein